MSRSHLEKVSLLIGNLRHSGLTDMADSLQLVVDAASTGTELLMGVSFQLGQMDLEAIPEDLRGEVKELKNEIDDLLL